MPKGDCTKVLSAISLIGSLGRAYSAYSGSDGTVFAWCVPNTAIRPPHSDGYMHYHTVYHTALGYHLVPISLVLVGSAPNSYWRPHLKHACISALWLQNINHCTWWSKLKPVILQYIDRVQTKSIWKQNTKELEWYPWCEDMVSEPIHQWETWPSYVHHTRSVFTVILFYITSNGTISLEWYG